MTKTSTPSNLSSSSNLQPVCPIAKEKEQQEEIFYNSIKLQLNELVKSPSDETIEKILAYARKK
ncbi:MAG: hypothetical protein EOO96_04860 [Pedobacter sp.]|nr:MAG: hypothetical protein EOO96_04860 [Pedobacter sp.]